jgi:hypothetical protein
MTRLPLRRIAVAVSAVAVLGVACGNAAPGSGGPTTSGGGPTTGPTTPVDPGISHPGGSDDLIVRIEDAGGFVAPQTLLVRIPMFSLYGDGTLITTGAQTEIYPQPALPPVLVQHLSEDAVQRILELAKEAGLLGKDATYMNGGVADATTTVFTVVADGGRHVVQAYALGFEGGHGLPPGQAEARKALLKFENQMTNLDKVLPAGSFDEPQPWDPTGLRLFVTQGDPSTGGPTQQPIAWPLDQPLATFGDQFGAKGQPGSGARCGTVQGADLDTLLPAVQHATQITPWTDGGSTYGISFRPLLPDESGCPPV